MRKRFLISLVASLFILSKFTLLETTHSHKKEIDNPCIACISTNTFRNSIHEPQYKYSKYIYLKAFERRYVIKERKQISRDFHEKSNRLTRAPPVG